MDTCKQIQMIWVRTWLFCSENHILQYIPISLEVAMITRGKCFNPSPAEWSAPGKRKVGDRLLGGGLQQQSMWRFAGWGAQPKQVMDAPSHSHILCPTLLFQAAIHLSSHYIDKRKWNVFLNLERCLNNWIERKERVVETLLVLVRSAGGRLYLWLQSVPKEETMRGWTPWVQTLFSNENRIQLK